MIKNFKIERFSELTTNLIKLKMEVKFMGYEYAPAQGKHEFKHVLNLGFYKSKLSLIK